MMNAEKILEGMNGALGALTQGTDVESSIREALRCLERVAEKVEGRLDPITGALDRAAIEIAEALSELDRVSSEVRRTCAR
ncbi:MAG: DNA repair protein RecN, partial [Thermoanaerobaculia bacterium]|nr:DNA repair protein RecN [Thermoanaerobaculia bacterium]